MKTFFLPREEWGETCTITGSEAQHICKVLRMHAGEQIRVLDGQGTEGTFEITSVSKQNVGLRQISVTSHPVPAHQAYIAIGWGKSVRRSWIFEKAVELEAAGVWLWAADRSQSKVPEEAKENWQAQLVAGAKQCDNPWLPELKTLPSGVTSVVEAAESFDQCFFLWEGHKKEEMLSTEHLKKPGKTLFIIGPEGGFSEAEAKLLKKGGVTPLSLGNRILRWETAALLCLGLHFWSHKSSSEMSSVTFDS
ncbi:16S rRNA (uracil(1498)-N(3))-methyltransferase [Oleidesulfovibrio sp.]|uniref:16S rRNA (uracil(1498)-N(3))-methyltransferase n=1 Tax=Oleidesulfovibrio sp. TaxID=2909707 RepID=UPI003A861217